MPYNGTRWSCLQRIDLQLDLKETTRIPDDLFDPLKDGQGPTVYVGANIPHKLNQLLQEEAQCEMVTRSDVIRWALADRYKDPNGEMQTLS